MPDRETKWDKIPLGEKKIYVRLLLNDGYTRDSVGAFFGTTKNAIVGFQHTHLPALTGKKSCIKEPVTLARLEELLNEIGGHKRPDAAASEKSRKTPSADTDTRISEPTRPVAAENVSRKLTTDWRIACQHSQGCAYLALPDSRSCGRPGHDK